MNAEISKAVGQVPVGNQVLVINITIMIMIFMYFFMYELFFLCFYLMDDGHGWSGYSPQAEFERL